MRVCDENRCNAFSVTVTLCVTLFFANSLGKPQMSQCNPDFALGVISFGVQRQGKLFTGGKETFEPGPARR